MMSGSNTMDSVKVQSPTNESVNENNDNSDDPGECWLAATHKLLPAQAEVAREWIGNKRQGLKSWREFFKTDKFHIPRGPSVASRRVVRNVDHFQSNYFCVFAVLACYCILTSPLLLIALAVCLGLMYFVKTTQRQIKIAGRTLAAAHQYALIGLLSFPLFWIAGAGSVIFWVIGASIFVIVLHAFFYASEEVPGADFELETV